MNNYSREELLAMTLDRAEVELSNAIYAAASIIEQLEYAGRVRGNGHHVRQRVAAHAVRELQERWIAPDLAKKQKEKE